MLTDKELHVEDEAEQENQCCSDIYVQAWRQCCSSSLGCGTRKANQLLGSAYSSSSIAFANLHTVWSSWARSHLSTAAFSLKKSSLVCSFLCLY
jgi:hypothetical protein